MAALRVGQAGTWVVGLEGTWEVVLEDTSADPEEGTGQEDTWEEALVLEGTSVAGLALAETAAALVLADTEAGTVAAVLGLAGSLDILPWLRYFIIHLMDCDNIFLTILTGISFLILAVDFKVLEKMFQEFFKLKYYLPKESYE